MRPVDRVSASIPGKRTGLHMTSLDGLSVEQEFNSHLLQRQLPSEVDLSFGFPGTSAGQQQGTGIQVLHTEAFLCPLLET